MARLKKKDLGFIVSLLLLCVVIASAFTSVFMDDYHALMGWSIAGLTIIHVFLKRKFIINKITEYLRLLQ
jgi:hypothetical protein